MNVLDLFSGIGGFSLGLERAGFKTVAFCEIDKKAQLVLKKHWPQVPIYDDVSTITKENFHGQKIDVICGGFPCQDISFAGKGAGLAGARSGLWFQFHRLTKEIRPRYAIIENVAALRSRGLDEVLRSLAEIGYDAEWHCIPASAVGAPHRRDRVWIVAYPNNIWVQQHGTNSKSDPKCCFSTRSLRNDRTAWSGEKIMAYSTGTGLSQRGQSRQHSSAAQERTGLVDEFERCGETMADSNSPRLERQWEITSRIGERLNNARNVGWWAVEPDVGRVAYGIPKRVDRLKQLGNSVVPQIPELIGKAIMNHETD